MSTRVSGIESDVSAVHAVWRIQVSRRSWSEGRPPVTDLPEDVRRALTEWLNSDA